MKNRKIKAVIFDMDGLMFDTEHLAADGWQKAAKELGFTIGEDKLCLLRGISPAQCRELFIKWYGDGRIYDEGRKIRVAYVQQTIRDQGIPVKPGLTALFAYLKENHYQKAIATSSSRETTLWYFEMANIPFDFDRSVCGAEVTACKPAPDVFLKSAEVLGLAPAECVVLEDSFNGVRASAAAGCHTIMIPDIQQPTPEIRNMCDAVCKSLQDVPEYLSLWSR